MNRPFTPRKHATRPVRRYEMLSAQDEGALVVAWQQHGDRLARDRLVLAFAPLANAMAHRAKPGGSGADPDLLQQANIGLIKAIDRFDPARENRFSTYAVWWIRAEMQDYLHANTSIVRRPNSAQARQAARQLSRIEAQMDGDPSLTRAEAHAALSERLGVTQNKLDDLRAQVMGRDQSLDAQIAGQDGERRIDRLVDPSTTLDPVGFEDLEAAGLRRRIAQGLSILPHRERDIILATQFRDPPSTLEGLGAEYGISKERVRQLRESGFERLRAALRAQNIDSDYFRA